MAQLTIYLDECTREKIEIAARSAEVSVSKWVERRLEEALEDKWPEGYFQLFGTLADSDLERPDDLPFEADSRRERLGGHRTSADCGLTVPPAASPRSR